MQRLIFGIAGLIASATLSYGAPVVIDGLTQGSINLSSTGSVTGTNNSGVDTIDGNRAINLLRYDNDGGTTTATLTTGGPLNVGGNYETLGLAYGYRYSGGGFQGQASTELNADLSGTNGIEIDFSSITGVVDISLSLITDYGNGNYGYTTNGNPGDAHFDPSSPGAYFIPYSQLQTINGGADLSNIDLIDFDLNAFAPYSISRIAAVPEPMTLAPLALAAVALRRRRAARANIASKLACL